MYMYSGTSDKGHLCIKDTFRCTNLYSGNTFLPLKEDNLSIMEQNDPSQCVHYLEVPLYIHVHYWLQHCMGTATILVDSRVSMAP